eukprot:m.1554294 g.1554294  ORF g.1554294 m.1554294 type:complete len:330 (-) comp25270_c1_seq39:7473-8462(-)
MKPIALSGHTRSLTQIKYNLEGDLLFSVAKDSTPSCWYSHNGERLGSYEGHNGTVWCVDVRWDSSLLITGSADNSCRLWDVRTGECICAIETKSAVRSCGWSYSGNQIFYSTDKTMGQISELRLYTLVDINKSNGGQAVPYLVIPSPESKITSAVWGPLDETIITGHDNGDLCKWDAKTGERIARLREHKKGIMDIQVSKDQGFFITASKDCTSKLFDMEEFRALKLYKTERPVNSAAISPLKKHVVLGGGEDAMSVTQSAGKVGKFDAVFWHMIFEEEMGKVKGHFGPINTLAFHPTGKQYSSGGEDGYIRIHNFDQTYFDFEFEVTA